MWGGGKGEALKKILLFSFEHINLKNFFFLLVIEFHQHCICFIYSLYTRRACLSTEQRASAE